MRKRTPHSPTVKSNTADDVEIMKELERYHENHIINNLIRDFKKIERELGSNLSLISNELYV